MGPNPLTSMSLISRIRLAMRATRPWRLRMKIIRRQQWDSADVTQHLVESSIYIMQKMCRTGDHDLEDDLRTRTRDWYEERGEYVPSLGRTVAHMEDMISISSQWGARHGVPARDIQKRQTDMMVTISQFAARTVEQE